MDTVLPSGGNVTGHRTALAETMKQRNSAQVNKTAVVLS